MNSRARAFVLAAIVASIAVLAVLPAEDVTAQGAEVTYDGYESSTDLTHLSVVFDDPVVQAVIVLTDTNGQTYRAYMGDNTTLETSYKTVVHGNLAVGSYTYTIGTPRDTDAYVSEASIAIDEVREYKATYTITWVIDGVSEETPVANGATPYHEDPVKEADSRYTYEFAGWSLTDGGEVLTTIPAATEDATYYAVFTEEAILYNVTVVQPEVGGTVSSDPPSAAAGTEVVLSNTPADGYKFISYSVKDANNEGVEADDGKFVMPASNVTVTATFQAITGEQYDITIDASENGSVNSSVAKASEGANVTLTISPAEGYELDVLTVDGSAVAVTGTTYSFAMPAHAVAVSATFRVSETPAPVDSGIAIGDVQYATVKDALAAARSGDVITISKAVSEDIALVDGVSISVTKDGSYTGTVSYDGSSVKFVKLGAGSVIAISVGSVDVSGNTFVGESEVQVLEGTMVLSGEISTGATVTIDVESGADLTIGDPLIVKDGATLVVTGEGSVSMADPSYLVMEDTTVGGKTASSSRYIGPAFMKDMDFMAVAYGEGSRITYDGTTYAIYKFTVGVQNVIDVRVAVAYLYIEYQTRALEEADIEALNLPVFVIYASSSNYDINVGENRKLNLDSEGLPMDKVRLNGEILRDLDDKTIENPGLYENAFRVYIQVFAKSADGSTSAAGQSNNQNRWVDSGLIISTVDLGTLTGETSERFVYDGTAKVLDLTKVSVKNSDGRVIALDLTDSEVEYTDAHTDVGQHVAVIKYPGNGFYASATITVTFEIIKAQSGLALIPSEATWPSEKYSADDRVKYSLGEPEADGTVTITASVVLADENKTSLQLENATITYADDKDAFQTALDDLIASITAEKYGQQVDQGYVLTLVLKSENGVNVEDGQVAGTYTVTPYTPEKIRLVFTSGTDGVIVAQDGTAVAISGQAAVVDGKAVFQVNVSSPDTTLVTEKDVRGYTVVAQNGAAVESAVFTATGNGAYITFTLSQPATDEYDVNAYAAKPTDSRYYDSDTYRLDLSGLKLTAASFRGIILEKDGDYPDVLYTQNQVYDLTSGEELTDNVKFYLPASNTGSCWTLTIDGVAKEKASVYRAGTVYLVDSDDRSLDGLIHFVATGGDSPSPVDPTETQSITISATGYYADADAAKDAINSAIKGLGLTSEITDVEKDTMFVIWYHSAAGTFTGTLTFDDADGQTVTCDLGQPTSDKAGYGIIYFTSYKHEDGSSNGYVEGFEKYVAGTQYTITIADGDVSAKIISGNSGSDTPAPSTETSTDVKAALRTDDTGVYLMLIAADDKAIPSGTVTVTYSYLYTTVTYFGERTTLLTGTMTIPYTATDKAYAYIALDFASDATASGVYSDIVGASAVFSDGTTSYTANMVSFTLPARA